MIFWYDTGLKKYLLLSPPLQHLSWLVQYQKKRTLVRMANQSCSDLFQDLLSCQTRAPFFAVSCSSLRTLSSAEISQQKISKTVSFGADWLLWLTGPHWIPLAFSSLTSFFFTAFSKKTIVTTIITTTTTTSTIIKRYQMQSAAHNGIITTTIAFFTSSALSLEVHYSTCWISIQGPTRKVSLFDNRYTQYCAQAVCW